MIYSDIYQTLKTEFNKSDKVIRVDSLSLIIKKLSFNSTWFNSNLIPPLENDASIECNNSFDYFLFEKSYSPKSNEIILLFHGLNEKTWDKYLPWAYQLMQQTGKSVLLFPIAFHMNRAPNIWSDPRKMKKISLERSIIPSNLDSSYANASLSSRIQSRPERFYFSGLQTYFDVCGLIKSIKAGKIKELSPNSNIDLFGYSVGAFLSLLFLMDNPNGYFSKSRLFMFCGGSLVDRTFPVSKYILDKLAFNTLSTYLNDFINDQRIVLRNISNTIGGFLNGESYFQSLISSNVFREMRETRLNQISERIGTLVLKNDNVIRPTEVVNTLKNKFDEVKSKFEIRDFDYAYNHVVPFPILDKYKLKVDTSFKSVFESASSFLV